MATPERSIPNQRTMDGDWKHLFSYHAFEPVLDHAEGIYLYDKEGTRYIDASGGPIAMNIGHSDRRVVEAITRQAEKYAYCHPALSNQPRAEVCARIAGVAPGNLNTTYLVSGGSEAVETAIKIARQYHLSRGNQQKSVVIGTWDSYHGMSLGALSVAGGPGFRKPFLPMLANWPHVRHYRNPKERPEGMSEVDWSLQCARELEETIYFVGPEQVSAFIATPIGAGKDYGLMPPKEYWEAVREICDRYDVLLIADEVVSGFGRTGRWFAMEHFGVQADIMTTAKGISGLFVPMGAVTVSDQVNEPFAAGETFVHGFTNMGHPLACAASLAVLDIIEKDRLVENSAEVGAYLHSNAERFLARRTIAESRGKGLLMVLELVRDKDTMEWFPAEAAADEKFQAIGLKNGLAFYMSLYGPRRPGALKRGMPIFIAPPLCITREQVDDLMDRLDQTLNEWETTMRI
ncbi:MAG TPA: aspartate aminotransferase family protein [Blastocatellia bacterium]|nr:aspartate aminotransferase family protein [Blastocatellia bacterium]